MARHRFQPPAAPSDRTRNRRYRCFHGGPADPGDALGLSATRTRKMHAVCTSQRRVAAGDIHEELNVPLINASLVTLCVGTHQ